MPGMRQVLVLAQTNTQLKTCPRVIYETEVWQRQISQTTNTLTISIKRSILGQTKGN